MWQLSPDGSERRFHSCTNLLKISILLLSIKLPLQMYLLKMVNSVGLGRVGTIEWFLSMVLILSSDHFPEAIIAGRKGEKILFLQKFAFNIDKITTANIINRNSQLCRIRQSRYNRAVPVHGFNSFQ